MNVADMTIEELEKRFSSVVLEIARIKAQIEMAKADYDRTGVKSNQTWYVTAKRALRLRGHEHQMVMLELAKRKKQIRREHNATIERKFVEVAKVRLSSEQFSAIFAEAELLLASTKLEVKAS